MNVFNVTRNKLPRETSIFYSIAFHIREKFSDNGLAPAGGSSNVDDNFHIITLIKYIFVFPDLNGFHAPYSKVRPYIL